MATRSAGYRRTTITPSASSPATTTAAGTQRPPPDDPAGAAAATRVAAAGEPDSPEGRAGGAVVDVVVVAATGIGAGTVAMVTVESNDEFAVATALPTPLEVPELAAGLGLRQLSVKDESARLGLPSFKIFGA